MEEAESQSGQRNAASLQKTCIGLVIVVFLAGSWVGAQQFAKSAVTSANFTAPYITTWFGTCWMVFCFPVYCIFGFIFLSRDEFLEAYKASHHIFGPQRYLCKEVFTKILAFNALWVLVNYLYIFALTYIAATDASAILSTNIAFVYVLSFLFLREVVYVLRIIASVLCIAGVILFGYADGFENGSKLISGVIMALFSAFGAALYKVFFKKVIFEGRVGQVSLFLMLLGVTNILIMWIFFLPLYFTGVEKVVFSSIPWIFLVGSSALSLVFNFLVNFGVAYTYPLFISIALVVGIPLNAAVDVIARGEVFSAIRLAAALLIVFGFCLMLLPDSWSTRLHRKLGIQYTRCYPTEGPENNEGGSLLKKNDQLPVTDEDKPK